MVSSSAAIAWSPAAAMIVSSKSSEIIDRITSLASGCAERMNDSVQQVHSSPCSQTTGMRGLVSSALAICCA